MTKAFGRLAAPASALVIVLMALGVLSTGLAGSAFLGIQGAARVLDWSELLPEGEEERLDQIYDSYYRDFERRMIGSQTPLASVPSDYSMIDEGSPFDVMPQLGTYNTVTELDGRLVRLPGFVVPLDFETKGRLRNFLFVPYFGACIHSPPPPPNQIVFVEGEAQITADDIWMPYWAEGVLHAKRRENELGNAAYTLDLHKLEPYEE